MVFKRSGKYKKIYRKRRHTRMLYTGRYIKRKSRVEFKSLDISSGTLSVNTTPSINPIVGIAQGTDINNRVGNVITYRSFDFKGYVEADVSATTNQVARIMFVWDTEPQGSAATANMIFGTASPSVNQERGLANRNRFIIMKDIRIPLAPVGQDGSIKMIKWYKRMYKESVFGTNAATIAAINKGVMLMVLIGNVASGTGDSQLRYDIRVRYTDI